MSKEAPHDQGNRTIDQLSRLRTAWHSDCSDCLVTFVLGEEPEELVLTEDEAAVVQLFTAEGLVPTLRYKPVAH